MVLQSISLNSLPAIFIAVHDAVCDIVLPIWMSRWTQCVVDKTRSSHFQFSTLMNHNQIIHKLLPQMQANNMAQKHVWLWVWVYLVKKQQVDELAQLVFGRHAAENCIKNLPEVLSTSLLSSLYIFLFPCLWPCPIRFSREFIGQHSTPETHLNNRHRHRQGRYTHANTHISLIQYLHQLLD